MMTALMFLSAVAALLTALAATVLAVAFVIGSASWGGPCTIDVMLGTNDRGDSTPRPN